MKPSPQSYYQARRAAGELAADAGQEEAVTALQELAMRLESYRPARHGWLKRLLGGATAPRGLYIYGSVGRGKSMLMDMFYETVTIESRRRVHFHQFMLEVHDRLHRQRMQHGEEADPLPIVARDIARSAWLLCFDEFHVSDIADAMILSRLFTALFDEGVVVVATSNWPPEDLYKDGLQRQLFLPFIDVLRKHMNILQLKGAHDHRLARILGRRVYFNPLSQEVSEEMARIFSDLADGASPERDTLMVQQRAVDVPRAARGVAWFNFAELCERPLGAADYLAIAQCYNTILLDGVPRLHPDQKNETLRFMTLIDALYENKVKLIMAADAPPGELYASGPHAFTFQRTVSRLMEMQAEDYIKRGHLTA